MTQTTAGPPGIGYVEIGSSDLERSIAFYKGVLGFRSVAEGAEGTRSAQAATGGAVWLDAGPARLKLVDARGGDLGGWRNENHQRGIRHVGLKVGSVDAWAERLRAAGVEFTLGPVDAVGDVRIAFFPDPDGTNLEIIEGHVHYHTVASEALAAAQREEAERVPATAGPVFDHVAVTVEDLDATLALYRDVLGFEVIGGLDMTPHPMDLGFVITYLRAGRVVLEVFSFTQVTFPNPWTPREPRLGLRHVAVATPDPDRTAVRLAAAGARPVGDQDGRFLTDLDGTPLRLVPSE